MDIQTVKDVLIWCAVIEMGLLLWWFVFYRCFRDWIHRFHGRWFRLSPEQFDAIHYGGMALLKLGMFMLHLVPWVALEIVT